MQKKLTAGLSAVAAFLMSGAAVAHQGPVQEQVRTERSGWSFAAGNGESGAEAGGVEAPIVVAGNSSSNSSSNSSNNSNSNSSSNSNSNSSSNSNSNSSSNSSDDDD